jgi:hypothetical protein
VQLVGNTIEKININHCNLSDGQEDLEKKANKFTAFKTSR